MTERKSKVRILLVDDEAEFRQAASTALVRQGFEISEAESGEQAIAMIREAPPDLMVLDLRMEGMDGISTLQEVRKFQPALPVIILTGHGKFSDAMAGIRFEVVDFVQKPVDLKKLGERIRKLLAGERRLPLRERRITELMVPVEGYARVYVDQTMQEIVEALRELSDSTRSNGSDPRRGTLLVFDRQEDFAGLIRLRDVVWMMVPRFLQDSPYSSYFTGMFLAQTKIAGQRTIEGLVRKRSTVEPDAPLMEAVHAMAADGVGMIPIVRNGNLVGILRDEELFAEIAVSILGE